MRLERLPALDADAVARLLTGAALHEAFLATYAGERLPDATQLAHRFVNALGLTH